jgi:hypothetical protein
MAINAKKQGRILVDLKYFILLRLIINQQNHFKMKKSLIAAALLIAFGTVTFAQDAAKTTTDKKTTTKTEKKTTTTKMDKKAPAKKMDKKAAPAAADKK